VFGVDQERLARRLLLEFRDVEGRLPRPRNWREPAAGHADRAPAIGATDQLLPIRIPLIAHMDFVRDVLAAGDVVADLPRVPEEVVAVELQSVPHGATTDLHSVQGAAVPVDEGLNDGVVCG